MKRKLFNEIKEGFVALAEQRQGKRTLPTSVGKNNVGSPKRPQPKK